ncbi:MAG: NAD(P)H-quinone oxidoreductase [Methylococcales bacterium]
MRVIEIEANTLKLSEHPVPKPSAHQVLIKVAAAGVNRPDIMQRQGLYPPPPGASALPGLEIAGTVVALGADNNSLKLGDQVCALVTGGGYAEYCPASTALCLPLPEGYSFIQAAAIPETFFTVWSNVFDRAKLSAGETLLVHGGSGGIGSTAIQLAKAFNANIIVTAGSTEKCRFCLELGAAAAINYHEQDFVAEIKQITQQKGVDVILDMIGGDYFAGNIKCLADEGRLVQIAIQNGNKAEVNLWSIMAKRLTITGSTLRARDDAFKAAIAAQLLEKVWPLLAAGTIKPIIHSTFNLIDAGQAHALMESSRHNGKIILTV